MSSLEHEAAAMFPFGRDDVFKAVLVAVDNLPGMYIGGEDPASGRILVGMGLGPGGVQEMLPVSVVQVEPGRTRIAITPVAQVPGGLDPARSNVAMQKLVAATAEALKPLTIRADR